MKHNITPSGVIQPTGNFNQSDNSTQNERNDVTHTKQKTHTIECAFCLSNLKNKLPRSFQNSKPQNISAVIAITTRQSPNKDTFDVQIKKRKRAPNKKNSQLDINSPSKILRDNSTQTDPDSSKGEGQSAHKDEKYAELFMAIDQLPTPQHRHNLMRIFNEELKRKYQKRI